MSSSSYQEYFDLKCLQCEATGQAVCSWTDYDYPSAYCPDNWDLEVSDDFECVPVSHPRSWMSYSLVCAVCGSAAEQTKTGTPASRTATRRVASNDRHFQPEHSPADLVERQIRKRAYARGFERGASARVSLVTLD